MFRSAFGVIVLSSLICVSVCLHVAFDLNGWKALPLDNKRVVDSIVVAADRIGGTVKEPVTAFQWEENAPNWDLYRVSFKGRFQQGANNECHADVVWIFNPYNVTVFNRGCIPLH